MTSKYELSISLDYAPDWKVSDALREFAQNCYDGELMDSENTAEIKYDSENEKVYFVNKKSILTRDSMLLGNSPKANDESTIGRHGEGYKLGIVVLHRNGKNVTINNYEANEIWTTKVVDSRRFQSKIIRIDIEKKLFPMYENGLIIEVSGITSEEWEEFKGNTLKLQGEYEQIHTDDGDILLSPEHAGKLFVSGLYVASNKKFKYGYNFLPSRIKLDRDRRIIDSFDCSWEASSIWLSVNDSKYYGMIYELLSSDEYLDASYISSRSYTNSKVAEFVAKEFVKDYGDKAVPISNESDRLKIAGSGVKGVIVSKELRDLIQDKVMDKLEIVEYNDTLPEELKPIKDWYNSWKFAFSESCKEGFTIALYEAIKKLNGETTE